VSPTTANSRIQTAGFVELAVSPKYEDGQTDITRWGGIETGMVMIVDRDFDVLLGFDLKLKLCGVPTAVVEMMLGVNLLTDAGDVTGGVVKDDKRFACRDPLMLEVWSKNVADQPLNADGSCDNWIHWLLPLTNFWALDGDLTFNNGTVEVALRGFGSASPGWYPSAPDSTAGFGSYVDGWPTGPPPVLANPLVTPDAWTLGDLADIRAGGPLAWKCVPALPSPLDECGYVPADCVEPDPGYELSFVAPSGEPPSPPWRIPDPFIGGAVLPQFTDEGVVATDEFQIGVLDTTDFELACVCEGNVPTIVTEGVLWQAESGGDVVVPPILAEWTISGADVGSMYLNASYSGGTWYLGLNISDWTTPDGVTPIFQSQSTSYALVSPVVPQDGDDYRLEAFYDPLSFTVGGSIFVRLFVNDVEVGDVAWSGINTVSSGFGHLFDTYAPPCEPVGLYGSPVNPAVPYFVTVTDLGGGVYNVLADDSNQSGMISDPLGPVNNDGGASGMCQPNSLGAACSTDLNTPIPQAQTYNDGTNDYTVVIWPPLITAITTYAASGSGWKVGLTYDLSDQGLALNADSTAGIIFGLDYRDTLAGLVALHGSGVPFPVTSPAFGSAAVTCYNNLYPLGGPIPPPILTDWGFSVVPPALVPGGLQMSSVTSFAIRCAPAGEGAPGVWPTFTKVT
jgi:hypothetical protein